jgi:hypothetical protein
MAIITHRELVEKSEKWLRRNGFPVTCNEKTIAVTEFREQPDVLGFTSSTSVLLEIKVSRNDFLSDFKKVFRIDTEKGVGEWRFYVCPEGLICIDELPKGWGLIELKGRKLEPVYGWPPNTLWSRNKPFIANKQAERQYMYSMLRRKL